MNEHYGLFVTIEKDGQIKRKLVPQSGEEIIDFATVKDELLRFANSDMTWYLENIRDIRTYADSVAVETDDLDRYGELDMDCFDDLVARINLFISDLQDNPIHKNLTASFLEDTVPPNDGSAMFAIRAKSEMCYCVEELYAFWIVIQNIFLDYIENGCIDTSKYPFMQHSEFQAIHTFDGDVKATYYFRSPVKYYVFLLMEFLSSNPNLSRCRLCDTFFIAKTKKPTLYCDNIYKDGKTCKEIGPKLRQRENMENDEVLRRYIMAQRKMYKRLERATDAPFGNVMSMDYTMYATWLSEAQTAKQKYLFGELSAEEALKIIDAD